MIGNTFKQSVERIVLPIGRAFAAARLTANAVTVLGFGITSWGCWLVAAGTLRAAGVVLIVGGMLDAIDGAVARVTSTVSVRGAFLDSTLDRVSDGLLFAGATWFFREDALGAAAAMACLVLSFLTSYLRAKAEGLGFEGSAGFIERGERYALAIAGLVLGVFRPALLLLAALSLITVTQRFVSIWRQAAAPRQ